MDLCGAALCVCAKLPQTDPPPPAADYRRAAAGLQQQCIHRQERSTCDRDRAVEPILQRCCYPAREENLPPAMPSRPLRGDGRKKRNGTARAVAARRSVFALSLQPAMPKYFNTNRLVFGIPQPNRVVYVVISLCSLLLFGGILFGYSSLQKSFERERYFASQCSNSSLDADVNNVDQSTNITQSPRAAYLLSSVPCAHLNSEFYNIFVIGAISATLVPVVIGPIQDRVSNMWARVFAACMVSCGLLSISTAGKEDIFLVKVGAALLGAGGNGYQLTSFPMAVLFPNNAGLVTSFCTGFFSISSFVFFVIQLLQSRYAISLSTSLLHYTYASVAFLLLSFVWPHDFAHSDETSNAPTVIQDEVGSSMRISSRQSIRKSRQFSVVVGRNSTASSAGRMSWTFQDTNPSSSNVRTGAPGVGKVRPTWPSGAVTPVEISLSECLLPKSVQVRPADTFGTPIDCDAPSGGVLPSSALNLEGNSESGPACPLTGNEEMAEKLKLTLLSGVEQLRSREYMALVTNFFIGSMVSDLYIGSYLQQTRRLPSNCSSGSTLSQCNPQQVDLFETAWSAIYPLGALASPLFGIAMDRLPFRNVFLIVVLVSICHQVTNLIPIINLQYFTYVMFACGRQVIFGFFYSSLGILFGFNNYGLLTSVSAVLVAGLIYINQILVNIAEAANSYFLVNVIFLALTVCLLPLKLAFAWSSSGVSEPREKLLPKRSASSEY